MNYEFRQQRINSLHQMLFEMATGNFSFRVHKTGHDKDIDQLTQLLAAVAEAMEAVWSRTTGSIPVYSVRGIVQTTFVLSTGYRIRGLSTNALAMLGYNPEMLFNLPFGEILHGGQKEAWDRIMADAANDEHYHATVQLAFITAKNLVVPAFCTISRLLFSDKIFVSTVTTSLAGGYASHLTQNTKLYARPTDAEIAGRVYDYILEHLEDPMPTARELSQMFGTNEFRIKDGFKNMFNTSVYKFYSEERLTKAHLLIQQSDAQIKAIAYTCGYNDYTNFYKAFKKRFGYAPNEVFRADGNAEDK